MIAAVWALVTAPLLIVAGVEGWLPVWLVVALACLAGIIAAELEDF